MTASTDPYRVLGLEPGASQADVKRAYRRLAKALHPDAAGERALPAFLEVQEAYERLTGTRVRTVRGPTAGSAAAGPATGSGTRSGGAGSTGFREPWRADPARARAAREQARSRRPWPPSGTERPGAAGPAAGERRSTDRPGSAPGNRPDGRGSGTADQARATGKTAGGSGRGRRRASRKATMGSTSYDEAREATDARWGGASWYGPTTGEYWIVNPREYADPRKHGPGYSNRGRTDPDDGLDAGPAPGPASAADGPPESRRDDRARPRAERPPGAGAGTAEAPGETAPPAASGAPASLDAAIPTFLRPTPADPSRRLALVLLAWPPIGVAVAGLIGDLTGCSTYGVACDGSDPFLPWLAQAVIVGLLLLLPSIARVLALGTVALLVAVVPLTAALIVIGGAASAGGGAVLSVLATAAWSIGVGWGIVNVVRSRRDRPDESTGEAR